MNLKSIAALLTTLAESQDFLKKFSQTVTVVAPEIGETGKICLSKVVVPILNEITTLAKSEQGKEALDSLATLVIESQVAIAKTSLSENVQEKLAIIAEAKAKRAFISYSAYIHVGFNEQQAFDLLLEDRKENNNKKVAQAIGQALSKDNTKKDEPEELEKSK